MKEVQFLEYVSGYRDAMPKGSKRYLIWLALVVHAGVLAALIVVPLTEVDRGLPPLESVTTFLVHPPAQPPPPPPPPAPAPPRASGSPSRPQPRLLEASFVAPIAIPDSIPMEEFGGGDSGIDGGVEGGIPGGVVGGIVGGLPDALQEPTQEPVRLDSRKEEAKPITRVEPIYPPLAAQSRLQGIVILDVLVDVQGVPSSIKVLRSVPMLEAAAMDAVRQWRWKPYTLEEQQVPFRVTVTVNFRLA